VLPSVQTVAAGQKLTGPLVVDLDPTTFCDLACPECISGTLLNQGRFTKERLFSLAEELVTADVKAVVLIGGGEPLAHPGTGKVIQILGEAGLHVGIVTNGTMIDRHMTVLSEHATWLRVSVDAATEETYSRVRPARRGRSVFEKVISNMHGLAAQKSGSLGYSFLLITRRDETGAVVESNHGEVLAAAELAKSIGCDYFELKTMFNDEHFVMRLPEDVLSSVRQQLTAMQDLRDETFDLEISSTFTSVDEQRDEVQPKEYHACGVAELRTLVTPNGVYVCSYHRGNERAKLGDAVEQNFIDLWRDSSRSIVDPSQDCRFHCARHPANQEIMNLSSADVVSVPDFDRFI
jgi:MoaA/NifB/PqqE/SkfB family radical SAM enzyme